MGNALMMRYAASRGENRSENRNESRSEGRNEMREGMRNEMRNEMMAGPAQPNHQVGTEQRMAEDREYRGNRYSRMTGDGMAENRYRGEDGRYKSGSRRNMMDEGVEKKWEFSVKPTSYQVTKPGQEHIDPYQPDMRYSRRNAYAESEMGYDDPPGRVIGFMPPRGNYGAHMEQKHMHGEGKMEEAEFTREDAEEWVDGMMNEDEQHPMGGKWEPATVKPYAEKVGFPTDGPEFWTFYAVMNALYSDFCKVLKEYNVTNPMAYAKLAKAWIRDKDAVENKAQVYWECIVKPKKEEEG